MTISYKLADLLFNHSQSLHNQKRSSTLSTCEILEARSKLEDLAGFNMRDTQNQNRGSYEYKRHEIMFSYFTSDRCKTTTDSFHRCRNRSHEDRKYSRHDFHFNDDRFVTMFLGTSMSPSDMIEIRTENFKLHMGNIVNGIRTMSFGDEEMDALDYKELYFMNVLFSVASLRNDGVLSCGPEFFQEIVKTWVIVSVSDS